MISQVWWVGTVALMKTQFGLGPCSVNTSGPRLTGHNPGDYIFACYRNYYDLVQLRYWQIQAQVSRGLCHR